MTPVDVVVERLRDRGCNPRPSGDEWSARCPAHDDRRPSLSVGEGRHGCAVVHCHTSCSQEEVVAALGLSMADLFVKDTPTSTITATYDYTDETGELLYQVVRYSPKAFKQRRPNGNSGWNWKLGNVRRVPYRLPEVHEAVDAGRWVVIVEGEKDVETLERFGIVATTNAQGAGKWPKEFAAYFKGARVALIPDNDPQGEKHIDAIAGSLKGIASKVVRVAPVSREPGGDVTDWLNSQTDHEAAIADLKRTITQAEPWEQPSGNGHREVYLVRASELEMQNVDYLEEPLLPVRMPTLVTGVDGVGKSTILYAKAALATRGLLPGMFKGQPVDVVIASCEDHPESVILPRLIAAGADLERVHIVKVARNGLEGDIALPDDLDDVARVVERVGARFLIIDPLVGHMPLHVDSHKAQHVRSVLAPLARLAEERALAVACVVHFNGTPSTDVRTRISGSKALRDAARSVIVCGADPSDESRFVMVQDKNSNGPKPTTGRAYRIEGTPVEWKDRTSKTSRVVWLGEVEIDSRGLLAGPGDPEERTERDEASDFLRAALGRGPQPAADVKKAAAREGIAERTLHRARRQLRVIVERSGFNTPGSKGSTWALPFVPPPDGTNEGGTNDDGGTNDQPQGFPGSDTEYEARSCLTRESGTNGAGAPEEPDFSDIDADDPAYGLKVAQRRADHVRAKRR